MSTPSAKKARLVYKEDKVAELESFLFGTGSSFPQTELHEDDETELHLARQAGQASRKSADDSAPLFFEDRRGQDDSLASDDEPSSSEDSSRADSEVSRRSDEGGSASTSSSGDEGANTDDKQNVAVASTGATAAQKLRKHSSPQVTPAAPVPLPAASNPHRSRKTKGTAAAAPAWEDPQEEEVKVNVAQSARLRKLRTQEDDVTYTGSAYASSLRRQHVALNPRTSWATLDVARAPARQRAVQGYGGDSDEEAGLVDGPDADASGDALLRHAGGLMVAPTEGGRLPPGSIEITRLRDANQHDVGDAVLRAIDWHPSGQLMLTGGLDKTLRVFQVDGVRNPKVQSMFLEDCPISTACFASEGTQVVAGGRRPFLYVCNLSTGQVERVAQPSGSPQQKSLEVFVVSRNVSNPLVAILGDQGYIPLVSLRSRQWAGHVKMNGSVRAASFTPDGNMLLTTGGDGLVYTWDLRMRRCVHTLLDEGNIGNTSALAMSPGSRFLATGSGSGVVNVYRGSDALPASAGGKLHSTVPPIKALMNLTTTIDTMAFNSDAQMLAVGSRMKKDAFRLVHLPSLTVFSNWPTSRSPLGHVHCAAFSPGGGLLAIGNAKGRALLYRLTHYPVA